MKTIYRIIIAGGRDFNNYNLLKDESLKAIYRTFGKIDKNNVTIVSGHAKGADALGERFAKEFGLNLRTFPADWDKNGKGAGFIRNREMTIFAKGTDETSDNLEIKNLLVAFWNGESRGTQGMIELAKNKKMNVVVIKY